MYSLAEYECTCPKVKLAVNRKKKKDLAYLFSLAIKKEEEKRAMTQN